MITDRLFQFSAWGVRKIGLSTLVSLLLLLIVLTSIALGLEQIAEIQQKPSLILFATLGLLSGWLLARSTIPGWAGALVAAAVGIVVVMIQTAQMGGRVATLARELLWYAFSMLKWQPGYPWPDNSLLHLLWMDVARLSSVVLGRLGIWLNAILTGAPAYDQVAVTLVWGCLVWIISAWSGWAVRRRADPLLAVLPGAALLAIGMAYSRLDAWYLLPVLSGAWLLLAWVGFTRRRQRWDRAAIDYAEDIHFDLIFWSSLVIFGIVAFSSIAAIVSPQRFLDFVRRLGQPRSAEVTALGESLGLQDHLGAGEEALSGLPPGELPREHLLGSGPELGRQVVMLVEAQPLIVTPTQPTAGIPKPSYYWRALTYDLYTGRGWATSATYDLTYPAYTQLASPSSSTNRPLEQRVQVLADIGTQIHFAGTLVSVDQEQRVAWRVEPAPVEGRPLEESAPPDMFGATLEDKAIEGYQVKSLVNIVGTTQLLAAGEAYPLWIKERYLQLPETLPGRVIDLAEELTAGVESPYEKAQALENYLRQIPYTLDVPRPPAGADVADYFLFELGEGYCDYYATAMAVMGRVVGLPTRLVMGYATGLYDESQMRFIITAKDAHSWVEVYFPGIGWVEFEPTGGLPAITRPDQVALEELSESIPTPLPSSPFWINWLPWLARIVAGISLFMLIFVLWILSDSWRLSRMPAAAASESLFRRLFRQGEHLEITRHPGDTPHEFNANLNAYLQVLSQKPRWRSRLQPARNETQLLVNLYTQTVYSPHEPDPKLQRQAIRAWSKLSQRLWLARLLHHLSR